MNERGSLQEIAGPGAPLSMAAIRRCRPRPDQLSCGSKSNVPRHVRNWHRKGAEQIAMPLWTVPMHTQRTPDVCWEACGRMMWDWRHRDNREMQSKYALVLFGIVNI